MKRRVREALKSVLIVLLLLALLPMTYLTWFYDARLREVTGLSFLDDVARDLGLSAPEPPSIHFVPTRQYKEAAFPVRLVLTNGGRHWGSQYDAALTGSVYERAVKLPLGEALGSAADIVPQPPDAWHEALQSDGLYLEYADALPLPALAMWMSAGPPALPEASVRRLALVRQNGAMWLYFVDERDRRVYRCETAAPAQVFQPSDLPGLTACTFGWETEEYAQTPYTLLFASPPRPFEVAMAPAWLVGQEVEDFLRELGINPDTNARFTSADGITYMDDLRTCRFSTDGLIRYRNPGAADNVSANHPFDEIELARSLLATLTPILGRARLSLSAVEKTFDGKGYVLTFAYLFDDIEVRREGGGPPVKLVFSRGVLTDASIQVCSFRQGDAVADLLPVSLAYLLTKDRHEGEFDLNLVYEERDGLLSPGWGLMG